MIKRKYGWHRDTHEARMKLGRQYQPQIRAQQFPDAFDLGDTPNPAFCFLDQGNLGACTGFGCKRVAWYGLNAVALLQNPPAAAPEPSALFQYYNERVLDGDVNEDAGSTISQGITALKRFGICPEKDWPYQSAKYAQQPPPQAYTDAQLFQALAAENIANDGNLSYNLMDCLYNQRLPIVFGSDLFQQFESAQCARDGIVTMPGTFATPIGGHCQVIRGWRKTPQGLQFKINNSWGQWGDGGCDWMPDLYLAKYGSDFWAVPKME